MELKNKIEKVIADIAGIQLAGSADMITERVVGWDSLRQAELIIKLQRAFAVRFKYTELKDLNSVSGIERLLKMKLSHKD